MTDAAPSPTSPAGTAESDTSAAAPTTTTPDIGLGNWFGRRAEMTPTRLHLIGVLPSDTTDKVLEYELRGQYGDDADPAPPTGA